MIHDFEILTSETTHFCQSEIEEEKKKSEGNLILINKNPNNSPIHVCAQEK